MSFLSFNFAFFLTFGLLVFHLGPARWRPLILLALSYAFYFTWGWVYTLLLAAVSVGVYATALLIEGRRAEQSKRAFMALGVMTLLIILFAFKAGRWLVALSRAGTTHGGFDATMLLVAPLGLSYYVFKMVGYLLDVYWEQLPAQRNFVSLALYASFFPQIVCGPIQRAEDFFSQLPKFNNPETGEFVVGLRRILFGLFKKVVIADQLALVVDNIYKNPSAFSSLELLFGAYCYAFQLYTDFSGLTDIAIGLGQLFGIKGPENFDLPFFSPNIQQFWRRWHMSLTSWLTDYLFVPLRMSLRRWGTTGLCLAIMANLIAVGLWHGLTVAFFLFGTVNGIYICVSVLTLKKRDKFFASRPNLARARVIAGPLLTFHLVVFALIFFRAQGWRIALHYFAGLVPGLHPGTIPAWRLNLPLLNLDRRDLLELAIGVMAAEAINYAMRQRLWIDRFAAVPRIIRWGVYYVSIAVLFYNFKTAVVFIYAQF